MANHCFNSLDISGSVEDIKKLEEFIKKDKDDKDDEEYDLRKIIPVEVDKEGFFKGDIYEMWGTKWIDSIDFNNSGGNASMSFTTAWSPSLPVTLEMSRKFNLEINHYYEESGNDFEGEYEVKNGVVVFDKSGDYKPHCCKCGEKFDSDKMTCDDDGEHCCFGCGDKLTGIVREKIEMIKEEDKK